MVIVGLVLLVSGCRLLIGLAIVVLGVSSDFASVGFWRLIGLCISVLGLLLLIWHSGLVFFSSTS